MKKLLSLALALLMLMGIMVIPTMAAADEVSVYLFGEKLEFDVPAQIVNGRTMVPMRKIFEELGATVDWNNDTRTVTSVRGDKTIILTIDSYTMYVNGEAVTLDVAPCIVNKRTLVPARAVSESFDLKVDWDNDTRSVLITELDPLDKNIVAEIGDYDITEAYYNCCYYVYYSQYAQYGMYYGENWLDMDTGDGITFGEMIKNAAKNQIEMTTAAAIIAKNTYGITADSVRDSVDATMNETIESYDDRASFDIFLQSIGSTERGIRTYFEMYAIYDLLLEKTSSDGKATSVSEADAEMMFNAEYGGKMKVQHILIATESLDGNSPSRTDAQAKAVANEILTKLKKGESFGKLITEYNEDPGQTADSYYVFGDGEMVEEFEVASKNLADGEYTTQAVKTAYGYHIIKKYPLDKTSEEYMNCKKLLVEYALYDVIETERKNLSKEWNL